VVGDIIGQGRLSIAQAIVLRLLMSASGVTQIGSSVSISCYITLGSRMGRSNFARR
jgi:hypothetical protein